MLSKYLLTGMLFLSLMGCQDAETELVTASLKNDIGYLTPPLYENKVANLDILKTYHSDIQAILKSSLPVVLLNDGELRDEKEKAAQSIAIHHGLFLRDVNKRGTGEALHSEIMNIRIATPQELVNNEIIKTPTLYRVEMYNFYYNTTTIAFVDVGKRRVVKVRNSSMFPNKINDNLSQIAVEIALSSPEVLKALGATREQAMKLGKKMNTTKCERSRHLCVAPTFTVGNKELWVIVDLTDLDVVGHDWVAADPKHPKIVTERSLQNEVVVDKYCDTDNELNKDAWNLTYTLTGSDGLEIKAVSFEDQLVLTSAKIVDWHVTYEFKKGFGYSDAMGCPMFSAAAVVAFNAPIIEDIVKEGNIVGFALVQDFRSPVWPLGCNYRYQNRFEFYNDGRFRVTGVNLGLGCGKGGWYRPVFRMTLASNGGEGQAISKWEDGKWKSIVEESWTLQDESTTYSPKGHLYQIKTNNDQGFYLEPGQSQFGDGGRGDNAYTYIAVDHKDGKEGAGNMPVIGACCNTNHEQGPEAFLMPAESLGNKDLVIWYVPQMPNDDTPGSEYCWVTTKVKMGKAYNETFAGIVGPMFVPFNHHNK